MISDFWSKLCRLHGSCAHEQKFVVCMLVASAISARVRQFFAWHLLCDFFAAEKSQRKKHFGKQSTLIGFMAKAKKHSHPNSKSAESKHHGTLWEHLILQNMSYLSVVGMKSYHFALVILCFWFAVCSCQMKGFLYEGLLRILHLMCFSGASPQVLWESRARAAVLKCFRPGLSYTRNQCNCRKKAQAKARKKELLINPRFN